MILVKPSHEVLTKIGFDGVISHGDRMLRSIEAAGRVCYKSEDKISADSAKKFVAGILKRGHESVVEHENITVKIICDRGVTHEIVRHRLVAYSQESTRYCNYRGGVTFVIPPWLRVPEGEVLACPPFTGLAEELWLRNCWLSESHYKDLLKLGWTPQQARSVLPNSLKTEIVMTANIREWRHILKLRTSKAAHPQMQEVMIPILKEFRTWIPILFDDFEEEE